VKPLLIWLGIVAVVFGAYALVSASLEETEQVFVYVDASNPMEPVWRDVPAALERIGDRDDAEFALARGQSRGSELIHSWQPELRWSSVEPFAPCSFDDIESFPEAADADVRILVTTSESCDTSTLTDWEIVLLD
jgi:hypothetical protein